MALRADLAAMQSDRTHGDQTRNVKQICDRIKGCGHGNRVAQLSPSLGDEVGDCQKCIKARVLVLASQWGDKRVALRRVNPCKPRLAAVEHRNVKEYLTIM